MIVNLKGIIMKKWHIGLIVAAIAAVILGLTGTIVYKFYITPNYIEPIVEEISDYLKDEDVLEALYEEAVILHDEGVINDSTYSNFLRVYNERHRDDEEYARRILQEKNSEKNLESENNNNSVSARYASNKVGVEIIKVKDGSGGKADVRYSDERTTDRIQVEDVIEAEKILEDVEKTETEEATSTPKTIKSVYEKLRANMESSEFSTFTKLMSKLDIDTLKTYITDKEGLKVYLHKQLSDDEYREAVRLAYKYVYILLDE